MRIALRIGLLLGCLPAAAHEAPAVATYLANEGVMVEHGDSRALFDPLFNEGFGQYRLVPEGMRAALLAGEPPWDGVDAVLVSHYHDDHFDPADMLTYLRANAGARLFAPEQAVAALRAAGADAALLANVTAVALEPGDDALGFEMPGLVLEAIRIPHAGWPTRHTEVENLAWRVTLGNGPVVLHLGDADTRDVHFAQNEDHWDDVRPDLAMLPYWYFLSASGTAVLEDRLRPRHAIGIHVPVTVPAEPAGREAGLRHVDLFTRPGETRPIPHRH